MTRSNTSAASIRDKFARSGVGNTSGTTEWSSAPDSIPPTAGSDGTGGGDVLSRIVKLESQQESTSEKIGELKQDIRDYRADTKSDIEKATSPIKNSLFTAVMVGLAALGGTLLWLDSKLDKVDEDFENKLSRTNDRIDSINESLEEQTSTLLEAVNSIPSSTTE